MADSSMPNKAEAKKMRDAMKEKREQDAAAKAYKEATTYPETEDVLFEQRLNKETPTTASFSKFAVNNLFGKDVPFYKRAAGAAALVPAAAANITERGIRAAARKISGDEEGKKKGGSIKKYAKGGSVRGHGCEQRGKTKGKFV